MFKKMESGNNDNESKIAAPNERDELIAIY